MLWYLLFVLQLILIFLTSMYVMQKLFHLLNKYIKSTSVCFYLLSLLYLPGTLLHELSHLITSIILFVPPHGFDIIPQIDEVKDGKYHVRLGSVHHAQTDPIRSMLIGASPIVFGLSFFYIVFQQNVFPHESVLVNIGMLYLFFAISSSMFSSKQDLKESALLIPLLILLGISLVIGFDIPIADVLTSSTALERIQNFNAYIAVASTTNTLAAIVLRRI